jgi:hypothetical protein
MGRLPVHNDKCGPSSTSAKIEVCLLSDTEIGVAAMVSIRISRRPSLQVSLFILLVVLNVFTFFSSPPIGGDETLLVSTDFLHPATVKEHFSILDLHTVKTKTDTAADVAVALSHPLRHFQSLNNATLHSPNFTRPSFESIVKDHRNNVIVGDLQFLLDFAIIGFAKCGTSTMVEWLGAHPQVLCSSGEMPHLTLGKIGLFAKRQYNGLDADPRQLRAYKNPTDIQNLRAIRLLREYFPHTKLLIGIRHPIRWFESFYNHRIQNQGGDTMPDPDTLGEGCRKGSAGVCGKRANYHVSLVRLGKTNYSNEQDAFGKAEWKSLVKDKPKVSPNPVFLYDTQQLADKNELRSHQFRQDLQDFLGLPTPLPEVLRVSPGKTLNATEQAARDAKKIHICDDQHKGLRKKLLDKSRHSAYWIRTYFLQVSDVVVSSPDYFLEIMDSYLQDPCDNHNNETISK